MSDKTIGLDEREQHLVAEKLSAIGPYRLLGVIGEGGMGAVYRALQTAPVEREVAIKVTRVDLTSTGMLARFEIERQTLASLSHSNIAAVYDGGETQDGFPYLVMEYIDGQNVVSYCNEHTLSIRQRLELFQQICLAVHYMHQRGVIHRDLKPANILVTTQAGRPLSKLIDFGVAKSAQDTDSHSTRVNQSLGTPRYMSPEQRRSAADVDIRTDVFSLGLLLCQLLVDRLPFAEDLQAAAHHSDDLMRPSQLLSRLKPEEQGTLADRTKSGPSSLRRDLAGDLDWIVLRAAAAEREQRYSSAAALAADIDNYLSGYAVTAKPPSRWYQLRKFISRHRVESVAALLLLSTLGAAVVMTSKALLAEQAARAVAAAEAERSQAINTFLLDLLKSPDPRRRGREVKVVDLLDEAANQIATDFAEQPQIRTSLLKAIAESYAGLGQRETADQLFVEALAAMDEIPSVETEERLRLENARSENGGEDLTSAEIIVQREQLLARARQSLGADHRLTMTLINNLAFARYFHAEDEGDDVLREQAVAGFVENLDLRVRVLGQRHEETTHARNNLAGVFMRAGKIDEAQALYLENHAIQEEVLGPSNFYTLSTKNSIGRSYALQENYAEAETWIKASIEGHLTATGLEHSITLNTLMNLADIYRDMDRALDEAEVLRQVAATSDERFEGIRTEAQERLAAIGEVTTPN